jgi:hypothetical protein
MAESINGGMQADFDVMCRDLILNFLCEMRPSRGVGAQETSLFYRTNEAFYKEFLSNNFYSVSHPIVSHYDQGETYDQRL